MQPVVTVTITDPITDETLEFTGTSDADVNQQIDDHFGITAADASTPPTTGPDADTSAVLDDARHHLRTAEINYASTPEGLAEYTRRWELATDPDQRDSLATIIAAGVATADEEYLERLALDNSTLTDGLLRALILTATPNDPVAEILVAQRIMGTYRQSDAALDTGRTRIALHRITSADTRIRTSITYPQALLTTTTVSLSDVISYAVTQPEYRHRLHSFLDNAALTRLDELLR